MRAVQIASTTPHIAYDHVEVKYSDIVFGLRDVSLVINRGEFVFLVGQSGAGKSTLLKLVTKELLRPTRGRVILSGKEIGACKIREIPAIRRQMGIVPQDFALLPRKRVYENVAYAMRAVGHPKKEVRKRVPEILEKVHIAHRSDAFPHELSGGEQQRVAIGRALINNPPLLLADEPTGNLDPERSMDLMKLLKELNASGTTVVVATHDMLVVEQMNERVVTMEGGKVLNDIGPVSNYQESLPLSMGQEEFAAVLDPTGRIEKAEVSHV
jgi:cell division transport system ATP-binding protein